jgi:hypothetical protein
MLRLSPDWGNTKSDGSAIIRLEKLAMPNASDLVL